MLDQPQCSSKHAFKINIYRLEVNNLKGHSLKAVHTLHRHATPRRNRGMPAAQFLLSFLKPQFISASFSQIKEKSLMPVFREHLLHF